MGPRVFVSPFGEPFDATPGQTGVEVWFAGADGDGDGRLTPAEFDADGVRWFMVLDADHDGRIGPGEVAAYETMVGTRLGGMRGGPGNGGGGPRGGRPGGSRGGLALNDQIGGQDMPGGGPGGPGGAGGGGSRIGGPGGARSGAYHMARTPLAMANLLNIPQPVKAADLDVNQFITSDEWQRTSARWFGLLDRDKDGALTLAELPALRSGGPGGRPGGGRGHRG